LIFSTSWRAVALGASDGSRLVTSCPSAGPLTFMKTSPEAVGDVLHQRGLAVARRRDEQQQAHEVGALGVAGGADLLGQVVADDGQVDLVDQLVAHEATARAA
jgi:hypothetical protein